MFAKQPNGFLCDICLMPTWTTDDLTAFVRKQTGSRKVTPDSDIWDEVGVGGDDFHELMEAYQAQYQVDMDGYLWYFHTNEEGLGGWWPTELFNRHPDDKVDRIVITPRMLTDFANAGKWGIVYPPHDFEASRKRARQRAKRGNALFFMGIVIISYLSIFIYNHLFNDSQKYTNILYPSKIDFLWNKPISADSLDIYYVATALVPQEPYRRHWWSFPVVPEVDSRKLLACVSTHNLFPLTLTEKQELLAILADTTHFQAGECGTSYLDGGFLLLREGVLRGYVASYCSGSNWITTPQRSGNSVYLISPDSISYSKLSTISSQIIMRNQISQKYDSVVWENKSFLQRLILSRK